MGYTFADKMSWEEQFKMMKRWYYRIRDGADDDKDDFYFAFFGVCHQFKDWLVRDGVATSKEVDANIEQSDALKLCADIATFHKHARVGRDTRTGDQKTKAVGRKYQAMTPSGNSYMDSTLEIENKGNVIYANLELVDECLNAWAQFLISKSLPIPQTLYESMAHVYQYPRPLWKPRS
jgi:hypothetical protein